MAPTKIFLIYYSMYGHIKTMAEAYAEGLRKAGDVEVTIYQVAETLPAEVLGKMYAPPKADYPIIDAHNLTDADAFVFGFPTRFGSMPAQFKAFVDATGQHWAKGSLVGKPYSCFTSTATQHGGQESTVMSAVIPFTHQGMIFVPSGFAPQILQMDEITGGSAWGPGTLAAGDGSRQPSKNELSFATYAGENFAKIAKKLAAP